MARSLDSAREHSSRSPLMSAGASGRGSTRTTSKKPKATACTYPPGCRFHLWLSHKSRALYRSPTKRAHGTPTPRPHAESTWTASALVGQIDNEWLSSRTYATATPACGTLESLRGHARVGRTSRRHTGERFTVASAVLSAPSARCLYACRVSARRLNPAGDVPLRTGERSVPPLRGMNAV
jgi:hypothetical protein